jgi:plasmid stabilization system protein ParE
MHLRLAKRAQRDIERKGGWWVENRPYAPSLFFDELDEMLEQLRATPGCGVRWPTARRPPLRRILMPATQSHVFFVVDEEASVIEVLTVRGAAREKAPKL